MGKKSHRSSYTSKGQRRNVSKSTLRLMKDGKTEATKNLEKVTAWRAGKNPWIVYDVEGKTVRVRANSYFGNPKFLLPNIYAGKHNE